MDARAGSSVVTELVEVSCPPLAEVARSAGGGCCRDCSPSNPNPSAPPSRGDKKVIPPEEDVKKGKPSMRATTFYVLRGHAGR